MHLLFTQKRRKRCCKHLCFENAFQSGNDFDCVNVTERIIVVLLVLLSCLIVLQQVNLAMMNKYRALYHHRQLLVLQIIDSSWRKRPKKGRKRRRFWFRPGRTSAWWDNVLNDSMLEEERREIFRMFCMSYFELSNMLRPYIECQTTHMHSPETQVAVTLYYPSDEGRLRKVANGFGLSRASCSIIIRRV